jgi:CheY-like chemotaxis protein
VTEPIRVVVADDHPLFREGVVAALQSVDDIVVVGQAADADGALRVVREELPDVVLLDVSRPGSGLQAAARIATACPATRRDSPGRTSGRGEARPSMPVGLPAGAAQPLTWRGGRGIEGSTRERSCPRGHQTVSDPETGGSAPATRLFLLPRPARLVTAPQRVDEGPRL